MGQMWQKRTKAAHHYWQKRFGVAYLWMAKQAGEYRVRGSIDGLCFYKMDGEYYVRRKSSLTGKRFWKDKAFEGSRKSCNRFAEGNKIASAVYQLIEEEKRIYPLFCFLKRRAILLLKEGRRGEEVVEILMDYLEGFGLLEDNLQLWRTIQTNRAAHKGKIRHIIKVSHYKVFSPVGPLTLRVKFFLIALKR
jgi:hypothetical protein